MNIGLYNLEPSIENTAMMKVSTYHKQKGDHVEIYKHPMRRDYDKIYAFSIFDFTDKSMVTHEMICGGTGFDIKSRLPPEIEACDLDYSIFPGCETSYLWFSRGCIRNCPFCVVRQKEGYIHQAWDVTLNPHGKYITVMDNNFFANENGWRGAFTKLLELDQPCNFMGVDARILTEEMAGCLNDLKHHKQIKIAWDNPREDMVPKLKEILQWIKPKKLMCYVLGGYLSTPREDLMRIHYLMKLKIDPFFMPFDKSDHYQKNMARFVNHKAILKSVEIEKYKKGLLVPYLERSIDEFPLKWGG